MVKIKNAKAFAFSRDEYVSFETVMNTMTQLQKMFPRETVKFLENPVTGEIVDPDDFARVKGVIDFLRDCPFEIIPM